MVARGDDVKHCRSHCKCGLHFSTDRAFDAHRVGPAAERECLDPIDATDKHGRDIFIALDEQGECSIGSAHVHTGVTVWGLRKDVEKARKRWGVSPPTPEEALSRVPVPPEPQTREYPEAA